MPGAQFEPFWCAYADGNGEKIATILFEQRPNAVLSHAKKRNIDLIIELMMPASP